MKKAGGRNDIAPPRESEDRRPAARVQQETGRLGRPSRSVGALVYRLRSIVAVAGGLHGKAAGVRIATAA